MDPPVERYRPCVFCSPLAILHHQSRHTYSEVRWGVSWQEWPLVWEFQSKILRKLRTWESRFLRFLKLNWREKVCANANVMTRKSYIELSVLNNMCHGPMLKSFDLERVLLVCYAFTNFKSYKLTTQVKLKLWHTFPFYEWWIFKIYDSLISLRFLLGYGN